MRYAKAEAGEEEGRNLAKTQSALHLDRNLLASSAVEWSVWGLVG